MPNKNSQKSKVVLLIPNSRWLDKRPWIMWPHSALILTRLLKDEFDFEILDANIRDLSEDACKERLKGVNPAAVLVSGFSVEYYQQYHIAASLAKAVCPETVTVLGGVYATVLTEEAVKDDNVDYVFVGHAEERIVDFLRLALAQDKKRLKNFPGLSFRDEGGQAVDNPVKTYISDVKELLKPDYSLIDVDAYLKHKSKDYQLVSDHYSAPIVSSYGCPHNCLFCAARTISGRKTTYRPVEHIIEEIEFLKDNYGVRHLVFLDDYLIGDKQRISKLLNTFIERNYNLTWKAANVSAWHLDDELLGLMKRSGCFQVTVSVESGNSRVLHKIIRKPLNLAIIPDIVKKCNKLGIDIGANFVIGLPGETWNELRDSFRFAEFCDFDLVHFHIATPLPKTDLYELAKKQKLIPGDFSFTDPRYFGFCQGFITTSEFSPFELMILRAFEWDRINFKTPEKVAKVAKMMNITIDELESHRKQTRLKCGIHF